MAEHDAYKPTPEEVTANIDKHEAEADAARAAAAKSLAEARKEIALAEKAEIDTREALRTEKEKLAADKHHYVYSFDKPVTDDSVKACITQLSTWSRNDPACDIEIRLNSPGGSIMDGFALIDFVLDLRTKGHLITTKALGLAASMAAVILQAGDNRVMGPNAILLIHEGSLGAIGSFGEVEDRIKLMEKLHSRIWELFASRAKPINPKTTVTFLKKLAKRTDVWLTAEEAMKLGLVDSVR